MGYLELAWGSPAWVLPLCLLTGFVWAYFRYGRNLPHHPAPIWRWVLGGLRGLAVSLLVLLFFNPTWIREERVVEPPGVVLAIDLSQSMNRPGISAEGLAALARDLSQNLEGTHRVDVVGFGAEAISLQANRPETFRLDQSLTSPDALNPWMDDPSRSKSVAAWVVVSDGLFNQGMDPRSYFGRYQVPVLGVGCGPLQSQSSSWTLGTPAVPDRVETHTDLVIEVPIRGQRMDGLSLQIEAWVTYGSEAPALSERKIWQPSSGTFQESLRFKISLGQEGLYAIRFKSRAINADTSLKVAGSPERLVFVEAVRTQKQLYILAKAPHPDLGVLRQVLEQTKNLRVELDYGLPGLRKAVDQTPADLYIWHQWPSANPEPGEAELLQKIQAKGQPLWWMGGARSAWGQWPSGRDAGQSALTPALPALNPDWNAFLPSGPLAEALRRLPPLLVPGLSPTQSPASSTLLYQQKERVVTQRPLWVVDFQSSPARAYLWGEGLWRWRLALNASLGEAASLEEPYSPLSDLVHNTVSLLTGVRSSEGLDVRPARPFFNETQSLVLEGSLRNAQGEFDNQSAVRVRLYQKDRLLNDATMNADGLGYRLDLGRRPAGTYRYIASTTAGGQVLEKSGVLSVQSFGLENSAEPSDHQLMQSLAQSTGGAYFPMTSWDQEARQTLLKSLIPKIKNHPTIRPQSSLNLVTTPWIEAVGLWIFVFLLLAVEWLMVRALGGV
ncbi:MAG: hypothetical protein ACO39U_03505 [Bacteroidia bacterium]